ncbi:protein ALP1-like [Asparagus officinalis]|uniref:protein ALP1-like n=1 Tax=Asparagus officinalis TaxID=4686 RepID=UPI00098DEF89|nr:protein ALP1-like [Asparagus officinalis]
MNGLRNRYMKQAPKEVPEEIANNSNYFPYFKDCIGLIDGTHVDAVLPSDLVARFRGRKGVTQNILVACTPNKLFTYVLTGWEGAANDYRVLQDAMSRPQPFGLRVYDGKYYLCDAGYTIMPGFISPYRGVRYHLKEHTGRTPKNRNELFNLRHSSLRSKIECAFGILKNRFKILAAKPNYPFPTQVDIVLACTVLHNFIALEDPADDIFNENVEIDEDTREETNEDDSNVVNYTQSRTQREDRDVRNEWKEMRDQIAWAMWVDYYAKFNGGNTMESGLT